MARFVALLRAVNVGGTGKLPMEDLCASLEGAGYANVQTLLASGNVVLETRTKSTARIEAEIEAHLVQHHALTSEVMVRTPAEWADIIDDNPMTNEAMTAPASFVAYVLKTAPDISKAQDYLSGYAGSELVSFGKRLAYVHFPDGMGRSKLNLSKLGVGTARNWNTVMKIHALLNS